jgi:hypothetical protein
MIRAGRTVLFLSLVAAMASQPASADSLFTTLGPGGSYDTNEGWSVSGSDYGNVVIGNLFTLGSAATVSDAVLALGNVYGPNTPVNVYIDSDNAGSPDSVLASLTQAGTIPSFIGGGGLVTFTCSEVACDLAAGNYWLVAVEPDSATLQGWFFTYNDATTILAQGTSGSPTGLTTYPGDTETAFQIDGPSTTPEPSSFLLLGSGLLGLAGLLKRKLAA